jgi:hypothetical protein
LPFLIASSEIEVMITLAGRKLVMQVKRLARAGDSSGA